MSVFMPPSIVQRAFLLTISLVIISGVIVVPWLMTLANFAILAAFATGLSWVLTATYRNAQPASSLAQSVHDAEAVSQTRRR